MASPPKPQKERKVPGKLRAFSRVFESATLATSSRRNAGIHGAQWNRSTYYTIMHSVNKASSQTRNAWRAGPNAPGSPEQTVMSTYAVDLEDIRAAAERIAGIAHRTPVITCATLDRLAGRKLYFKCENLQKV